MDLKVVKIKKSWLKKEPADLLRLLGVVDEKLREAHPERAFSSKEDYAKLRKNLLKLFKKERPGFTKKWYDMAVGMELLNFGPNQSLEEVIRPGYMLIDQPPKGIKNAKKR